MWYFSQCEMSLGSFDSIGGNLYIAYQVHFPNGAMLGLENFFHKVFSSGDTILPSISGRLTRTAFSTSPFSLSAPLLERNWLVYLEQFICVSEIHKQQHYHSDYLVI